MRITILSILAILSLAYCHIATAQSYGWINTYGGDTEERGYFVLETDDRSLIIAGCRAGDNPNKKDDFIFKVDRFGNKKWELHIPDTAFAHPTYSLALNDRGEILAISDVRKPEILGQSGFRLIKISAEGELLWTKKYAKDDYGSIGFEGKILYEGGDEYTILVLDTAPGGPPRHPKLIRLQQDSIIQWIKPVGILDRQTEADVFKKAKDGGYIMAGGVADGPYDSFTAYAMKLDAQGEQEWYVTLDDEGIEFGQSISQLPTGEYIFSGNGSLSGPDRWKTFIMKLAEDGTEIWRKEPTDYDSYSRGVSAVTSDGNIIRATSEDGRTFRFQKMNPDGEVIWEQEHETGLISVLLENAIGTADGGAAFVGFYGTSHPSMDVIVIKINEDGLLTSTSNESHEKPTVTVYPNPSYGTVNFDISVAQPTFLRLFDTQGKLLREVNISPFKNQVTIDRLPSGVIIYEISIANKLLVTDQFLIYKN